MVPMDRSIRILIVDDEPDLLESLGFSFESRGLEVETAEDARTALHKLEQTPFDVVISDVRMPKMGGMDLYLEILKRPEPHPDVYLMSAYTDLNEKEVMEKGIKGLLSKPFKASEFVSLIRKSSPKG